MQIAVGRVVVAALAIEAVGILLLVALVAAFGPDDAAAAGAYAERIGRWVGPIAGFVLCLAGGWWVARGVAARRALNGFVLGAVVAAIDGGLLFASGASVELVFLLSNLGRIVAGTLGGLLASRSAAA